MFGDELFFVDEFMEFGGSVEPLSIDCKIGKDYLCTYVLKLGGRACFAKVLVRSGNYGRSVLAIYSGGNGEDIPYSIDEDAIYITDELARRYRADCSGSIWNISEYVRERNFDKRRQLQTIFKLIFYVAAFMTIFGIILTFYFHNLRFAMISNVTALVVLFLLRKRDMVDGAYAEQHNDLKKMLEKSEKSYYDSVR